MKFPSKIAAAAVIGLASTAASAVEVSYDFVEVDATTGSIEPAGGGNSIDVINFAIHGNKSLTEDGAWFVDAEVRYSDTDDVASQYTIADIAIAKRIRMNKDERNPSSMSFQAGYITRSDDAGTDGGLSLAVDFRANTDVNIEFGAGLQVNNYSDFEEFVINVRLMAHITELLGAYVKFEQIDREFDSAVTSIKENTIGGGIRFEF